MTTTKKTNLIMKFVYAIVIMACLAIFSYLPITLANTFAALDQQTQEVASNTIKITNGDFNDQDTTVLQSTPNGWSKTGSSSGKAGIIEVSESTFANSSRTSSYALTGADRPSVAYEGLDNHMLMINAKSEASSTEVNHMGYKSSDITLDAYSFYRISIWTLTQPNAVASVYVSGLGEDVENASFERFSSTIWTEYSFYIATGIDSQTANIELWLGSKDKNSSNAVFFDHVTMKKLSGSYFYNDTARYTDIINDQNSTPEEISQAQKILEKRNIIDLRDELDGYINNSNFELGDKTGWTIIDRMPVGGAANIVSVNNNASMESLGAEALGSDLSEKNNYAFMLYSTSKDKVSIGYESQPFNVTAYQTLKITVWAKISSDFDGYAYAKLQEGNDVKNFYGEDSNFYEPSATTVTISNNTTNNLTNNYTPYYLYVKGHQLFDTTLTLQLWLGNDENGANGSVVFDSISVEDISWSNYDSAPTSNTVKMELSSVKNSPSVSNGAFNDATNLPKEFKYPVEAKSWTSKKGDSDKAVVGIINTNSTIYNRSKAEFGGIKNPGNPSSAGDVNSDTNNMLMLYNKQATYQTVTSTDVTTSKQSYQTISFDYKTVNTTVNTKLMYVYVLDNENNILYVEEGLFSSNWSNYSILIRSTEYTSTIKLVIGLGSNGEDQEVAGYLYIDNVKFETNDTMTDEEYEEYADYNKTLDFTVTNFNFISTTTKYGIYTPYKYTQKLEDGVQVPGGDDIAYGGIIDGENNNYGVTNSENNENALKYMPALIVKDEATYSLTSKDTLTLDVDKFYKFSVDVYTKFWGNTEQEGVEADKKLKYGAIFALNGIEDRFTEIVSNDEWTTYTLFVEVPNTMSVNLKFGIQNQSSEIQGQVFFDNFKFETVEELEFNQALSHSVSDKTILAITKEALTVEDTTIDDGMGDNLPEEELPEEETNKTSDYLFYIIPSAILFIALVIAVAAYFMKKITIKKWERKRASDYDRDSTLHRDVIRREAEEIRNAKVKEVEAQIAEVKQQMEALEQENAQRIKEQKQSTGEITRAAEKEFKAYAKRHTALENDIAALNDKIDSYNMPEYLLAIQRQLILEKVKKERQSKQEELKKAKEQKKADSENK